MGIDSVMIGWVGCMVMGIDSVTTGIDGDRPEPGGQVENGDRIRAW